MDEEVLLILGGEAEGAVSAIAEIDDALAALEGSISTVAAATGEMEGLQTSLSAAASAGQEATMVWSGMADAMVTLDQALTSTNDELAALGAATDTATGSVTALGESATTAATGTEALGVASADAAAAVTANTDAVKANTAANTEDAAATEKAATAHSNLAKASKALLMPLGVATAAVVGIGAVAVHMAGDFQAGMASIVTGAGESQSNLKLISDGVLQLSTATGTSTKQLVAGLYMIESGGFHGAAGLDILKNAAEGAKVGSADLGVVADATDTILKNFGETGMTSAQAVNTLIATVANGKTHMQDLAASLAQILPTGAAAGVGVNDVMAAMATMTSIGVPAANAATYLRQTIIALSAPSHGTAKALAAIGLTTKQVSDEMHVSLPKTLELITDHLKKKFPEGSAGYIAAIKNIAGGSKQMQGMLDLTGSHLKVFTDDVGKISGAAKKGGDSIQSWALVQQMFNQQMDQAKSVVSVALISIGNALMPLATTLVSHLVPALKSFGDWISSHGQQAAQIFGIIAAVLGGALAAALIVVAVGFITANAAALPFIAIGAAVAGAVALLVTHWKQVSAALAPVGKAFQTVLGFLQPIGDTIRAQIGPTLKSLGETLHNSLIPAWHSLQQAFEAAKPILTIVGAILGVVLVVAVAEFLAMLKGLASAIGPIIRGIAQAFGGIVQVISGIFQVVFGIVGGLVKVIGDLLGGHFDRIGKDFLKIWENIKGGVGNIVGGLWHTLQGLFTAIFGGLLSFVGGFVSGFLGFFTKLGVDIPGIVRGIQHTVLGMVKGLLDALGHIPGPIGDMARKASASLDALDNHTKAKTAEMSASALMHTALMHVGMARHFEQMKQKLIQEIQHTTDPVKKHALEMKLAMVSNAEKTEVGAAKHFEGLASKAALHTREMAAKTKTHAKEMHDGVLGHIQDMASGALTSVGQWKDNILNKAGELKDQLIQRVHQLIENIKTTLHNGFERAKEIILAPINFVVGLFKWLYDHNYYFQHLVDAIRNAFTNAKNFITNVWHTITTWLGEQWHRISETAKQKWNEVQVLIHAAITKVHDFIQSKITAIHDFITEKFTAIHDFIQDKITAVRDFIVSKITAIRDFIVGKWNIIKQDAQDAWNHFTQAIQDKVNDVKTKVGNIVDAITTPLKNLATTAIDWGKNMVQGFISGITGAAGKVGDAAKNVAGQVGKFLGFHSPTEEGPGADADKWMPALGAMLERDLLAQAGKLRAASAQVAGAISGSLSGANAGAGGAGALGGGLGNGAGLGNGGAGLGIGGGSSAALLSAILSELRNGNNRAQPLGASPVSATQGAITQNLGGVTFNGVSNINQLFNALNQLAGYAQENGLRGATLGLGL